MNPSISNTVILNPAKTAASTSSIETIVSSPSTTGLLETPTSASSLTPYPSLLQDKAIDIPTSLSSTSSISAALAQPSAPLDPEILFKLKLLEILTKLISSDFALLQNILERTKKIIVHCSDLEDLIKILTDTSNISIIASPITSGCCSGAGKLLYYNIDRIIVDGYDLQIKYNYAYNVLLSNSISLDSVIADTAL
jgi:hypothetical protein